MGSVLLDHILGTSLIPTIMGLMIGRMYSDDKSDLLYITVAIGTIISTTTGALNSQIRSMTRSRNQLTLHTTGLLTLSLFASIIAFHLVRHNFSPTKSYQLPNLLREQFVKNSSEVFRYHFYADFIPGFIIFSQVQLCSLIRFDLMNRAKRTFTFGESFIMSQLLSGAYLVWALTTYTKLTGGGPFNVELTTSIILNIGVIMFTVVFLPCYFVFRQANTIAVYSLSTFGIAVTYKVLQCLVRTETVNDPMVWLAVHIFETPQRIILFSLWLSTTVGCVSFSASWSKMAGQTNSFVRKIFHLAACVIFISGYNQDVNFTSFAAGGMIIVMSLLELYRAWNVWPIGYQLETICQALRGEWDNRYLTVSHIYLLAGTMIPLWIVPANYSNKLIYSSGLISLGIGDTAAAIFGTLIGKTNLGLESSKTLEGLAGNIIAMAIFKLVWIGYSGFIDEFSFAMAAILTAFVEAATTNCDNLVLPLVMILSLQVF